MSEEYAQAYNLLGNEGYPHKLLGTYTEVYMLTRYNMGAVIMISVNGVMKELSATITRDPTTGEILSIIINISQ